MDVGFDLVSAHERREEEAYNAYARLVEGECSLLKALATAACSEVDEVSELQAFLSDATPPSPPHLSPDGFINLVNAFQDARRGNLKSAPSIHLSNEQLDTRAEPMHNPAARSQSASARSEGSSSPFDSSADSPFAGLGSARSDSSHGIQSAREDLGYVTYNPATYSPEPYDDEPLAAGERAKASPPIPQRHLPANGREARLDYLQLNIYDELDDALDRANDSTLQMKNKAGDEWAMLHASAPPVAVGRRVACHGIARALA